MKKILFLSCLLLTVVSTQAQSIADLINQTDITRLTTTVREFSGEDPTTVYGNPETILNRVSSSGNDVAAYYIKERMENLGLSVEEHDYSSGGKNIIATQLGVTNPNNVYLISAHYDAVANYCADDNASGVAAIMELARILAAYCTENTIVYAFWDEEESGLNGSAAYAQRASTNGENILGVFNIDMMGYDGDNDKNFDIDVRPFAQSIAMKDAIIDVLNNPAYGFDLVVNVVNPGTFNSDHASFWSQGYSAVLFGESWEQGDVTPGYHSSNDRINLFNMPYYHQMCKLVVGYMATVANPIFIDTSVSQNTTMLTATQTSASYQWVDCNAGNTPILGATNQSYTPTVSGSYAVEITSGNCTKTSNCISFNVLGVSEYSLETINVYPNPTTGKVTVSAIYANTQIRNIKIMTLTGQEVLNEEVNAYSAIMNLGNFPSGVYFLELSSDARKKQIIKLIKQ